MPSVWKKFARFIAVDGRELCGEPKDASLDLGLAFAAGEAINMKVLSTSSALDQDGTFTGEVVALRKLLSPLTAAELGTIRCVGMNYKDHVMKGTIPTIPEIFLKPSSCLIGPSDPIVLPAAAPEAVDIEVELAVVIGQDCKNASMDSAMDYVLGYTIANDLTCRDVQSKILQWSFAKSYDGFCPMGPVIVSVNAITDPSRIGLHSTVRGKTLQKSNTSELIFSIPEIISHCSKGKTLPKGTVILTGTPAGIGHSHNPPLYLREGSDAKLWIEGIGTLHNAVIKEPGSDRAKM